MRLFVFWLAARSFVWRTGVWFGSIEWYWWTPSHNQQKSMKCQANSILNKYDRNCSLICPCESYTWVTAQLSMLNPEWLYGCFLVANMPMGGLSTTTFCPNLFFFWTYLGPNRYDNAAPPMSPPRCPLKHPKELMLDPQIRNWVISIVWKKYRYIPNNKTGRSISSIWTNLLLVHRKLAKLHFLFDMYELKYLHTRDRTIWLLWPWVPHQLSIRRNTTPYIKFIAAVSRSCLNKLSADGPISFLWRHANIASAPATPNIAPIHMEAHQLWLMCSPKVQLPKKSLDPVCRSCTIKICWVIGVSQFQNIMCTCWAHCCPKATSMPEQYLKLL